ncbi:hypothetical protein FIBSPDRAFT_961064 [Athelia psychrophila]|uniref:Uncharacterized protein n=1 Tax=Athelia psychrophila TaxID=1759441 RepID=A0A166BQT4_9AGAM|nr:hypothetical protein FIBSPDRAFT_961064 [Fibularhizoctonia sp. CBS 109695]
MSGGARHGRVDTPDEVTKELFERFKTLKREILENAPIRDANKILEDEEAWSGLMRDLQLEDEAETVEEEIYSPSEGSNPEDLSSASSSVHQALGSTTSLSVPGTIPDEPPSPQSYWIALHPIEDTTHERGCIPEEPPVPLSHWIDLRPVEDYKGLVPEVAPDPTSTFLDLFPLDDSSIPEISPSPADFMLELHELHE